MTPDISGKTTTVVDKSEYDAVCAERDAALNRVDTIERSLREVNAERDALQQRCEGYQASRDWAIHRLAYVLGIEPDTMRAVEYYADRAALRIEAERWKHGK